MNILNNDLRARNIIMVFSGLLVIRIIIAIIHFLFVQHVKVSPLDLSFLELLADAERIIIIVNILVYITAIVFFILWFRRAYANLHRLGIILNYSEGWAAGAWFVPFLNLYRPLEIMTETWNETQIAAGFAGDELKGSGKLIAWWILYIGSALMTNFASAIGGESSLLFIAIADLCAVGALLLIINIIRETREFEKILFRAKHEKDITEHLIGEL